MNDTRTTNQQILRALRKRRPATLPQDTGWKGRSSVAPPSETALQRYERLRQKAGDLRQRLAGLKASLHDQNG